MNYCRKPKKNIITVVVKEKMSVIKEKANNKYKNPPEEEKEAKRKCEAGMYKKMINEPLLV